jgi:hypothetical protein
MRYHNSYWLSMLLNFAAINDVVNQRLALRIFIVMGGTFEGYKSAFVTSSDA